MDEYDLPGPLVAHVDRDLMRRACFRVAIMLSALALLTHLTAARVVPEALRFLGIGPRGTVGQLLFGAVITLGPVGLLLWPPGKARGLKRTVKSVLLAGAVAGLVVVVRFFTGNAPDTDRLVPWICAACSHGIRSLAWSLIVLHP